MATIRKRGKTYTYQVTTKDPATGKRKHISKGGFKKKKEAELAAAEVEKELFEKTYQYEADVLFKDFAEKWFREYSQKYKKSSVRARGYDLNHLLERFAYAKMKDITKKAYQDMIDELNEKGFAHNTIGGIHGVGKMIFRKAMEDDVIKRNPTEYAAIPKKVKTVEDIEQEEEEIKYLEKEELSHFIDTAKEQGLDNDYFVFLTLSYTGMRAGELCALKWSDINFDDKTIKITKTLYNPRNNLPEYELLPPKTKSSKRTILIDSHVLDELKRLKNIQNQVKILHRDEYYDNDFVFVNYKKHLGYPEIIKTVERRMKSLLKKANLNSDLTPHSLRHTHTSLLAEAGVSLESIMDRLGHKDDKTTKDVYMHVTKTIRKEASEKFSDLMKSIRG